MTLIVKNIPTSSFSISRKGKSFALPVTLVRTFAGSLWLKHLVQLEASTDNWCVLMPIHANQTERRPTICTRIYL